MLQQSTRVALWTGRTNRFHCYHQSEHSEVHKPDATHSEQGVLLLSQTFSAALQRLDWNKNVCMVFLNTYLLCFFFLPALCSFWSTCFPMCWKWRMETRAYRASQCNWSVGSQNWERHTHNHHGGPLVKVKLAKPAPSQISFFSIRNVPG